MENSEMVFVKSQRGGVDVYHTNEACPALRQAMSYWTRSLVDVEDELDLCGRCAGPEPRTRTQQEVLRELLDG